MNSIRSMIPFALATLLVACCAPPCLAQATDAEKIEFFERQVRPLLAENCLKCHGPEKQNGGLRLDSRESILKGGDTGPAIVPERPAESELVRAINYEADGFQMPPTGKLPDEAIRTLTEWVRLGAPWPEHAPTPSSSDKGGFDLQARARHWSFQSITSSIPPEVNNTWPQTAVDNFILARLHAEGLQPAADADRRTLIRRLSYDLLGLPPEPDEIADFLSDNEPGAVERLVDRMLASPRYGERWGRHWLDLVRFAETGGHEFDYPIPHVWPYRDYVIRALNADVPYDQFAIEHIAGDLLEPQRRDPVNGTVESVIGTGFYFFGQAKHSPVDLRAEECDRLDNQIDVLGKTFLGLTIACARCHDHKFDPITAEDYYALAGYIKSSRLNLANVSDTGSLDHTIDAIAELKGELQRPLSMSAANEVGQHVAQAVDHRTENPGVANSEPSWVARAAQDRNSILHPLVVLNTNDASTFATRKKELAAQLHQAQIEYDARQKEALIFENFASGAFDRWFVTGEAFGRGTGIAGDMMLNAARSQPIAGLLETEQAHSGLIAPVLQGAVRSPMLTVKHRFIHFRAKRSGGRSDPGLATKNGNINFVIDNFQLIREPLYGGLTINVPNDGRFRWLTMDLAKFQGKSGYLEILDLDDGWIAVDEIWLSNSPAPPEVANPLIVDLLEDPAIASFADLTAAMRRTFAESTQLFATGQLSDHSDHARIVDQLLENLPIETIPVDEHTKSGLAEFHQLQSRLSPPLLAVAITDGTPIDEKLLARGNPTKPLHDVPRRSLEVFAGKEHIAPSTSSGRLEFAREITNSDNPLFARVLVNRLWHHHFGRGLVASVDNFGLLGEQPTHPELLDYLASEFIRSGWSIKHMHRLMLQSHTYQLSSDVHDTEAERVDPSNKLLHRASLRRLEGEIVRDAMLAVSGRLDRKMYGDSIIPHLTPFMVGRGRPEHSGPLDGNGRASIYISVRRNFLTPGFLAFDYPTPLSTAGSRSVSNVPAQALTLMNSPFAVQQAEQWSRRLMADGPTDPEPRVRWLWERAFGRVPDDEELRASLELVMNEPREPAEQWRAWADLCHVLFNVKEFYFVR